MFRENKNHLQGNLFSFLHLLDDADVKELKNSPEYYFYELIFSEINEADFACLFSDAGSRPNAAINALVSALILQNWKGWTYEELFKQIHFNLLIKSALGLSNLDEKPFCRATIFNFQNRLNEHFIETGENLLERVFDSLTDKQLKKLKIKTDIQRADSFLAASNIRSYSRIQLLIEVLIRLHRVLSEEDKEKFSEILTPYVKRTAEQYIYRLKRSDFPHELAKLGEVYHLLYESLFEDYWKTEIFQIFDIVYSEHFTAAEDKIEVKPSEELHSGCLQSPDDLDATYRKKRDQESRGQTIHFSETANPENELNLVTDVAVASNNTDDSRILEERLEPMKEKTPDLNEYHTDGGYGSEANDKKAEKLEITHVQTAIRGKDAKVEIKIEKVDDKKYRVSCPLQTVDSTRTKKRHKALFDSTVCEDCPLKNDCPAQPRKKKNYRVFYFTHEDYLRKKRQQNIETIPEDRRKLRPNVEATVKEFKCPMKNGKLKVRGKFKTMLFAFARAVSINFGRIFRYLSAKLNPKSPSSPNPDKPYDEPDSYFSKILQLTNFIILLKYMLLINFWIFHSKTHPQRKSLKIQKNTA